MYAVLRKNSGIFFSYLKKGRLIMQHLEIFSLNDFQNSVFHQNVCLKTK